MVVRVGKTGLFSAFAHDHRFEVTDWRAEAEIPDGDPARASVAVVVSAASLRDREEALSETDRRKVDAQAAGPEVLDAERYPEIAYRAGAVTLDAAPVEGAKAVRAVLQGTLTLHGRSRPLDVSFEAERDGDAWRVRGRARLKQSDFGIRPFRAFGGTVGVKDVVEVELEMTLRPAPAPEPEAG